MSLLSDLRSNDRNAVVAPWAGFLSAEIGSLIRKTPPWYAGGFGHPDHVADFPFWARMAYVSVREAACLSVGVGPDDFPQADLDAIRKVSATARWPAHDFLLRRIDQMQRAFDPAGYGWRIDPGSFLSWVDRVEFEVHPEYLRLLRAFHGREASRTDSLAASENGNSASSGRENPREVDTMARLFLVIAMEKLGYDPKNRRSSIAKAIVDMASKHGISVSEDTVRKYLRRGASLSGAAKDD